MKVLVFLLCAAGVCAAEDGLAEGYRAMYNLQFDQAHRAIDAYRKTKPDDPMGPVSSAAAFLFSEFERLRILQSEFFTTDKSFFGVSKPRPDLTVRRRFDESLSQTRSLAEARLRMVPMDPDALLAETLRLGLSANFLSLIEKKNLEALRQVKESRVVADRLLAARPDVYDAHLAAGVENYLLSQKAAPVRWALRIGGAQTNLDTGIENLKLTAEKGRYLLPYARLLLAVADLRANNRAGARTHLEWLAREFPGNALYRQELERLR